jgi:putative holliday junction resolvase
LAASKGAKLARPKRFRHGNRLATAAVCCQTAAAMRILALDHGTRRIGVALSDETRTIGQPLEYIPAEPFADFLERLKKILLEKEISLILIGMPRNMDGSYGPAAEKVNAFIAVLKTAITAPIKTWDERLTSTMANRVMIQGKVRRDKRKEKVDAMAAAILLQSYLDMGQ